MRILWALVAMIALGGSTEVAALRAQVDSLEVLMSRHRCVDSRGRTIRGLVQDTRSVPIRDAWVVLPEYRCGTQTDSSGRYVIHQAPTEATELVIGALFYGQFVRAVESPRDTVIDLTLQALTVRTRDWLSYGGRPEPPATPQGVVGCYWLGHQFRPDSQRVVELKPDGTVIPPFRPDQPTLWRYGERGDTVEISVYRSNIFGFRSILLDFGEPLDWSAIPALYLSKTDAIRFPSEWDSFVTRVPCAAW